jgi:HEAT repeat protein
MPERRRARRRVAGILAGAVVITAMGLGVKFGFLGARRLASTPIGAGAATIDEKSPLAVLNEGLRSGDPHALAFIQQRVALLPDAPRQALAEKDAFAWIETLSGLRSGFPRLGAPGRATAVTVACRILDKFAVEPAPALWIEALRPLHDLLTASLADSEAMPRYTALVEVSRLWVWIPGRSLTPFEEQTLGEWKGAIHVPVVRCLAARDPETRMAAVACLGSLPIDSAALAAVAYVDDPSTDVRKQTLSSFSQRNLLLTDEMLLRRLHDDDPGIREIANLILKTRGLSQEQISLGGLIYSPKPEQRVSVIPLLKNRTDLDPVIWLIQLSRDPVEMVRMTSIEALAKHKTPTVQRRLAEMARSDGSEAVRQAASKVVPSVQETTAALPPLPGSSSLNPKAN